jgi:hypothetical protein
LEVRPGKARLIEWVRSEPLTMDGVEMVNSWPIIVEGAWAGKALAGTDHPLLKGLDPHSANERQAAMQLHRAVSLLSLAWSEAWQVRTGPTDNSRLPAALPASWPAPNMAFGMEEENEIESVPCPLPAWLPGAWQRLDDDSELAVALSAWHQGILMTPLFPSYALVAFAGSIEQVGTAAAFEGVLGEPPIPCVTCGHKEGATARFKNTIKLVRSAGETKDLLKRWDPYSARSVTAHGSGFHGIETAFGPAHMLTYTPPSEGIAGSVELNENDQTQVFMWQTLPLVRNIARDLLLMALGVDVPS